MHIIQIAIARRSGDRDTINCRRVAAVNVGERAFVLYFVHPFGGEWPGARKATPENVRSVLQVAELEYRDGEVRCRRDRYWDGENE